MLVLSRVDVPCRRNGLKTFTLHLFVMGERSPEEHHDFVIELNTGGDY